ncbi:D-altritol 5-dehydrogenase-like [Thrips palmi]|uniref:D-altritol 5-dehydrogenase-like n=1 Tax=Thrips palmi TaxID=161013 RepID=A0A6P8YKK5_THRPL|nr:D-altritol 5-dehydrogenase-like [Thrips palmi]
MATIEAIVFDPKAKKLSFGKVDMPSPPDKNEVIVKVAFAGICGTDLHIIDGEFPCKASPFILGHEFSGVATDIGTGVTHITRGDRVVVDPNNGCNVCQLCSGGDYHMCQTAAINNTVGIFKDGGWAQYCKVPADQVYRLPSTISLQTGALCEPISCLSHGWDRLIPVPMGSRVLVTGAGVIGALWVSALHHMGHRNIIVSEPNETRRGIIKKLDLGVQVVHPDELMAARSRDFSWGVDVCIDCSGAAPALEAAVTLLRPGGKLLVFGVAAPQARMSISPYEIYKKELTILGVMINPFSFVKSIGFLEAMGEKYLDYEKLGVRVFSLSQYAEAMQELRKGAISKAVFQL